MYTIRKEENRSPTKVVLNRSTSFGLGLTVFQLCWELQKTVELVTNEVEGNLNCNGCVQAPVESNFEAGDTTDEREKEHMKFQLPVQADQHKFQGLLVIGILLYAKVCLSLVDLYSYAVVRVASKKESLCDSWLGLYLQIALLTYNMTEILIGAYKGTFDGSSMLLAARATVRAISIEMICLFLREIKVKQEIDLFSYKVLNV